MLSFAQSCQKLSKRCKTVRDCSRGDGTVRRCPGPSSLGPEVSLMSQTVVNVGERISQTVVNVGERLPTRCTAGRLPTRCTAGELPNSDVHVGGLPNSDVHVGGLPTVEDSREGYPPLRTSERVTQQCCTSEGYPTVLHIGGLPTVVYRQRVTHRGVPSEGYPTGVYALPIPLRTAQLGISLPVTPGLITAGPHLVDNGPVDTAEIHLRPCETRLIFSVVKKLISEIKLSELSETPKRAKDSLHNSLLS